MSSLGGDGIKEYSPFLLNGCENSFFYFVISLNRLLSTITD